MQRPIANAKSLHTLTPLKRSDLVNEDFDFSHARVGAHTRVDARAGAHAPTCEEPPIQADQSSYSIFMPTENLSGDEEEFARAVQDLEQLQLSSQVVVNQTIAPWNEDEFEPESSRDDSDFTLASSEFTRVHFGEPVQEEEAESDFAFEEGDYSDLSLEEAEIVDVHRVALSVTEEPQLNLDDFENIDLQEEKMTSFNSNFEQQELEFDAIVYAPVEVVENFLDELKYEEIREPLAFRQPLIIPEEALVVKDPLQITEEYASPLDFPSVDESETVGCDRVVVEEYEETQVAMGESELFLFEEWADDAKLDDLTFYKLEIEELPEFEKIFVQSDRSFEIENPIDLTVFEGDRFEQNSLASADEIQFPLQFDTLSSEERNLEGAIALNDSYEEVEFDKLAFTSLKHEELPEKELPSGVVVHSVLPEVELETVGVDFAIAEIELESLLPKSEVVESFDFQEIETSDLALSAFETEELAEFKDVISEVKFPSLEEVELEIAALEFEQKEEYPEIPRPKDEIVVLEKLAEPTLDAPHEPIIEIAALPEPSLDSSSYFHPALSEVDLEPIAVDYAVAEIKLDPSLPWIEKYEPSDFEEVELGHLAFKSLEMEPLPDFEEGELNQLASKPLQIEPLPDFEEGEVNHLAFKSLEMEPLPEFEETLNALEGSLLQDGNIYPVALEFEELGHDPMILPNEEEILVQENVPSAPNQPIEEIATLPEPTVDLAVKEVEPPQEKLPLSLPEPPIAETKTTDFTQEPIVIEESKMPSVKEITLPVIIVKEDRAKEPINPEFEHEIQTILADYEKGEFIEEPDTQVDVISAFSEVDRYEKTLQAEILKEVEEKQIDELRAKINRALLSLSIPEQREESSSNEKEEKVATQEEEKQEETQVVVVEKKGENTTEMPSWFKSWLVSKSFTPPPPPQKEPASYCCKPCNFIPWPKQVTIRHVWGDQENECIPFASNYTTLELFLAPDYCPGHIMPIIDLRGHRFDNNTYAANGGFGGRYIPNPYCDCFCEILGFNAYYDYRQGCIGYYQQVGAGIEILSRRWDFRANAYAPFGSKKHIHTCVFDDYDGDYYAIKQSIESISYSFNGEIGCLLYESPCSEVFLYAAAGPYFIARAKCNDGVVGAEARIRPQFKDYLYVDLSWRYDRLFETIWQVEVSFNLPLYQISCQNKYPCCLSDRQIYQPIQRFEVMPLSKRTCWHSNF